MHLVHPNSGPVYHIKGRSLASQLRNGSAAARDRILSDLRCGKLVPVDLTARQLEHLVAACLVGAHRPPDENKLRARLDRQADKAVERLGPEVILHALDRWTQPTLFKEAAE